MSIGSQQFADLADHAYDRKNVGLQNLVGKQVPINGVKYVVLAHADKPSGYQGAIYQRVDTGEIVVSHRGTEFEREALKDGVLADGGMVFARANTQAADAIELTRDAIQRARAFARADGRIPEVTVTGHSLGGTLAQITAHHFDLRGETFNAYGAASLGYRIPEGGHRMLNHAMAGDAVSAASGHYGQVRLYARPEEIRQLQASGYHPHRLLDAITSDLPIAASLNDSHMMHNFLAVDAEGKRDTSALADPAMRVRAREHGAMIANFRDDVRDIRAGASLGGDAVDVLRRPSVEVPKRVFERLRDAMQPALAPGEPARREARGEKLHSWLPDGQIGPVPERPSDMRDPAHPAHARYRQAYAGVVDIDRCMQRAPDEASERVAAALVVASARFPAISHVVLGRDGNRAFAVDTPDINSERRQFTYVEVADAVRRPVEASTQDWQAASQQLALQQQQSQFREQTQPSQRGPVLA